MIERRILLIWLWLQYHSKYGSVDRYRIERGWMEVEKKFTLLKRFHP